jgi:hypothetical protein
MVFAMMVVREQVFAYAIWDGGVTVVMYVQRPFKEQHAMNVNGGGGLKRVIYVHPGILVLNATRVIRNGSQKVMI